MRLSQWKPPNTNQTTQTKTKHKKKQQHIFPTSSQYKKKKKKKKHPKPATYPRGPWKTSRATVSSTRATQRANDTHSNASATASSWPTWRVATATHDDKKGVEGEERKMMSTVHQRDCTTPKGGSHARTDHNVGE